MTEWVNDEWVNVLEPLGPIKACLGIYKGPLNETTFMNNALQWQVKW